MRYAGFAISPLQVNVQFDRHPAEGGGWVFSAKGVQSTLSDDEVVDARGAASAVMGVVWDGCDGWIVWYVREFCLGVGGGDLLCSNHQDSREGLRCRLM